MHLPVNETLCILKILNLNDQCIIIYNIVLSNNNVNIIISLNIMINIIIIYLLSSNITNIYSEPECFLVFPY